MKTLFTIFGIFVFTSSILVAQPTLNMDDIGHQIGDMLEVDSVDYVDVSDQVGANITWDLNDIPVPGSTFQIEVVASEEAAGNDNFPNSNIARIVSFAGGELNQFINKTNTEMDYVGSYFEVQGFSTATIHSDPERYLETPLTYGSSGTDTHAFDIISDFAGATNSGATAYEVVGYGTLLLDQSTYEDVLLTRIQRWDSLVTTVQGMEFNSYEYHDAYVFMKAGYRFPLATFATLVSSSDFGPDQTTFEGSILSSQTTTGINEISNDINAFEIYPNPYIDGELNLHFDLNSSQDISVELYDLQGKLVVVLQEQTPMISGSQELKLNLSDKLESGVYSIKLKSEREFYSTLLRVE